MFDCQSMFLLNIFLMWMCKRKHFGALRKSKIQCLFNLQKYYCMYKVLKIMDILEISIFQEKCCIIRFVYEAFLTKITAYIHYIRVT